MVSAPPSRSWLSPPGVIPSGESLSADLGGVVRSLVESGKVSTGEIDYISGYKLALLDVTAGLSEKRLERVRALCGLWDVDLKAVRITSHRPVIGPLIVGAKKLLLPFLKAALGDFLSQQRAFNREAVALLAELAASESAAREVPERR